MNVEGQSGLVNRVIAWADGVQRRHGVLGFPYAVVKKYGDDEGAGSCKHSPGPARLKKDIEYQAGGRHVPGAVRPAIFHEGSDARCKVAVACHIPIRLEGRTRTLSGPSPAPTSNLPTP
jgi:hypothetical protein